MIKNIRIRLTVDQRGKIKTGEKSEKGLPRSLDHFNVTPFPELEQLYGKKPTELILFMPSDNIEEIFDYNMVVWGGGQTNPTKKRTCDTEVCLHRIDYEIKSIKQKFTAGEETECICKKYELKGEDACRCDAHLKAFVANPKTGKITHFVPYLFETHSRNTGDAIYSELDKVRVLTQMLEGKPRLTGIPFRMSVRMVKGVGNNRFPIWTLAVISGSQLQIPGRGIAEVPILGETVDEPVKADPAEAVVVTQARVTQDFLARIDGAKTIDDLKKAKADFDKAFEEGHITVFDHEMLVGEGKTRQQKLLEKR